MALKLLKKAVSNKLLLGTCLPSLHETAAKIRVTTFDLDEYLLEYFKKYDIYYAHDSKKICKSGDIVLIKKLEKNLTRIVTHEVLEVIYPLGDVTDPITNKKCVDGKTRESLNKEIETYGKLETTFDYTKAPKRGWQEGKRDFTDRETYRKYHEFDKDDENYNDPYSVQ